MDFDHLLKSRFGPLLPGAVLVSILRHPDTRETIPYDLEQMAAFNEVSLADTIDNFCLHLYLTPQQATTLKHLIQSFENAWTSSRSSSENRARGFDYDANSADIVFKSVLSINLFLRLLQVVTPATDTYMKVESSDVDIIEMMENGATNFVAAVWSKLVPRSQSVVKAWGTRQLWVSAMQETGEACLSIIEDELEIFEEFGLAEFRGDFETGDVTEEFVEYVVGEFREKFEMPYVTETLIESYNLNEQIVSGGVDNEFGMLMLGCGVLRLQPICFAFLNKMCAEIAWAYARIDGSVSYSDSRFVENVIGRNNEQLTTYCPKMNADSSAIHEDDFETVLSELETMIGLESVKTKVREAASFARVQQMRSAQGLKVVKSSLHTVFFGNPGTGKTTVARLMGRIYRSLGILRSGHLIECDRSKLVAEYVGQTAIKTNEVIDSALDGILFVDEAYSLTGKGEQDYGNEAVDTLLKRMEDERERLIIIIAGYGDQIHKFIGSNPGLQSRFTNYIEFPDYNASELCRIFASMAKLNGLSLTAKLKALLLVHYSNIEKDRPHHFGNARDVRNLFELAIIRQASRLATSGNFEPDALSLLTEDDLVSVHIDPKMLRAPFDHVSNAVSVCPSCKQVFSWDASAELVDAQCNSCQTVFNVEFGCL